ncbi:MAG: hypothetical protein DHS20C06_16450 [Hyphobacterium sp.]|nr:MAG: hypothetical protein DHS20C06_16450 [Hyphobacterium sp.]
MIRLVPIAIFAALTLAACNNNPDANETGDTAQMNNDGGAAGSDNVNSTSSTSSGSSDDEFVAACLHASNMSVSMCTCLSEKADDDLSENSQAFLIATLNEQSEEVVALRARMSFEEMSTAGMFMIGASTECAQEGRQ